MNQPRAIVVPIALSYRNAATLTLPHFVQRAEYGPKNATHCPLVNGEEAFGAVYHAIANAKHSVDLVCWGFQPSMYFKRGVDGKDSLPIGDLLLNRAREGAKIRLLVWGDTFHVAQFMENMMPGGRFPTWPDNRSPAQCNLDAWWYAMVKADKKNMHGGKDLFVDAVPAMRMLNGAIRQALRATRDPAFDNIEFATRDFDINERAEIAWRIITEGEYGKRSRAEKRSNGFVAGATPSHHQKMVLVDYEYPELATGFVMGHNTLDEYWDTSKHSYLRRLPQEGRNGFLPRQDISARVTGPILMDLNRNFTQAWDAATGQHLEKQRESASEPLLRRGEHDIAVRAQILRTQSQVGKTVRVAGVPVAKAGVRDIERLYLQAINNTTNFVYIENQYFRFPPLAEKLTNLVKAYQAGGRKAPLYLFVVTNSSDDGIGKGTLPTYRMLEMLGRADVMPGVAKLERADALEKEYEAAVETQKRADQTYQRAMRASGLAFSTAQYAVNNLAESQRDAVIAAQRASELKEKWEKVKTEDPEKLNIPGLKVHICTLVPPDTPKGQPWDEVYIHSKLMIVDDVFVTHGSANLNVRSMEGDSELNIMHECAQVTQALREKLWRMHAGERGVGTKDKNGRLNAVEVFESWGDLMFRNKKARQDASRSPFASVIEFHRDDPLRSDLD